mmetsp:Transcript_82439/g.236929  ORF Transcript_82439/g.236929 Transcript_82439/m.236929 type:complete len:247 (+) Transcript_82439:804-1544(+)
MCASSGTNTTGSCGSARERWRRARSCARFSDRSARTTSTSSRTTGTSRPACTAWRGPPWTFGKGSCPESSTSSGSTGLPGGTTSNCLPTSSLLRDAVSWLPPDWSSATTRASRSRTDLADALARQAPTSATSSSRSKRSSPFLLAWVAFGWVCRCRAPRKSSSTPPKSLMAGSSEATPRPWCAARARPRTCPSTPTRCRRPLRQAPAMAPVSRRISTRPSPCFGRPCRPGSRARCGSSAASGAAST